MLRKYRLKEKHSKELLNEQKKKNSNLTDLFFSNFIGLVQFMKLKFAKIKEEKSMINLNDNKRNLLQEKKKKFTKIFLDFFYFFLIVLFAFFSYDSPYRKEQRIQFINKNTISQIYANDYEGRRFDLDFFNDFYKIFEIKNTTDNYFPYIFITPIRFNFVS
jgi:hypothetical protein